MKVNKSIKSVRTVFTTYSVDGHPLAARVAVTRLSQQSVLKNRRVFRRLRVDLPPLTAMPSRLNKKRSIGDEESPTTDEDEEPIIVTKRKATQGQTVAKASFYR